MTDPFAEACKQAAAAHTLAECEASCWAWPHGLSPCYGHASFPIADIDQSVFWPAGRTNEESSLPTSTGTKLRRRPSAS